MGRMIAEEMGVIVLAGTPKAARQLRWKRRISFFRRIFDPRAWFADRNMMEAKITSRINRDDYIWGENKPLLYLHHDLISQNNMRFFKRILLFARRTGDRLYSKKRKDLMNYLAEEGETSLELVIDGLRGSSRINNDNIVVVGPKKPLSRELKNKGNEHVNVARQGSSLGENILIGKRYLDKIGYRGDYVLIIGGDVPLATGKNLDDFIERCSEAGGSPDIYWGMGSRSELRTYIEEKGVEHLGKVGPNRPKKGYLNKFGIPFIDDRGEFGEKGKKQELMMGNVFLYRSRSVNRAFINRLYSMRKMLSNPLYYVRLLNQFGIHLVKALLSRMYLSEGEYYFNLHTGIEMVVVRVDPPLTLDIDSYSDLRRVSAIKLKESGEDRDLEMDFSKYLKRKKRSRKKSAEAEDENT